MAQQKQTKNERFDQVRNRIIFVVKFSTNARFFHLEKSNLANGWGLANSWARIRL